MGIVRRTMKAAFKPKDNVQTIVTHGMMQKMSRGLKDRTERIKSSFANTKMPFSRSSDTGSGDESDSDGEGQGAAKVRRSRWAKMIL